MHSGRINILLFTLLSLLLTTGCLKDMDNSATLTVTLQVPEDIDTELDLTTISVRLQNKGSSINFTKNPDQSGSVSFKVQPGKYDIIASSYDESTRIAINGAASEFLLSEDGIIDQQGNTIPSVINIVLDVAIPSPLIFREIYFHGSSTLNGATYTADTYLEVYNNSGPGGKTEYLDSMCIATVYPANSTTGNNAWLGRDTIPVFQMFWMFPGDGKSYPLAPGESYVVALRAAVDHSSRATSGLHLERAHFGCYDDALTLHEISAGVPRMVCYMAGKGYGWGVSIHSPAFILFKPEMGVKKYREDAVTWEKYEPGRTSGSKYWHVAKSWISDGVECVDTPEGAVKRLPSSVDAAYTHMTSPHYSGKCITRKLLGTYEGIEVYKDTNNSFEDFVPDSPLQPRLKK